MAASQILATGNTPADSGDITVVAGTPLTVALKDFSTDAVVEIKLKDDAGNYQTRANLSPSQNNGSGILSGPGVYRFSRRSGTCGVFSA